MKQLQLAYEELGIKTTISQEEGFFYDWLLELKDAGYIEQIDIQPMYQLTPIVGNIFQRKLTMKSIDKKTGQKKTKVEGYTCNILNGMSYTPDFRVVWSEKALGKFIFTRGCILTCSFKDTLKSKFFLILPAYNSNMPKLTSILEVKGSFASRHNSTAIKFPLLQKIIFHIHNIFVNKVMPLDRKNGLFKHTFTPRTYLLTDKTKVNRTIPWKVRSLAEYEAYLNSVNPTVNDTTSKEKE